MSTDKHGLTPKEGRPSFVEVVRALAAVPRSEIAELEAERPKRKRKAKPRPT